MCSWIRFKFLWVLVLGLSLWITARAKSPLLEDANNGAHLCVCMSGTP